MLNLFNSDRKPEHYPKGEECSAGIILIDLMLQAWLYESSSHVPIKIEEPFYADGSGRDYAITAMTLGKDVVKAVQ